MDNFDSFWEMDSDKKLKRKLNRPRRWRDDNSSTFFLRKAELKTLIIKKSDIYTYSFECLDNSEWVIVV